MKLTVGSFVTLDGVMQAPGHPDEDRSGGFAHGGWLVSFFDDVMGQVMTDWIKRADGLLLGRKTYEIFAAHWPYVTGDDPIASKFNSVRKHVVSRTLDRVDWNNSTLIKGDVAARVADLKRERGGELQVHGSRGAYSDAPEARSRRRTPAVDFSRTTGYREAAVRQRHRAGAAETG